MYHWINNGSIVFSLNRFAYILVAIKNMYLDEITTHE